MSQQEPLELDEILATSPTFTMIMYTLPINPAHLKSLQSYGSKHLTPLVAIHSAGLFSYFRASLPGIFPIVDTHPDEASTTDLRLLSPWPELREFAAQMTKDLDTMDNHEHGHIPYVVLLLQYLEQWKNAHGEYPKNYAEKTEFRKAVADGSRRDNPEGGEENFDEAVAAVVKTVVPSSLPSSLKEVFDHIHAQPVCFWEHPFSQWPVALMWGGSDRAKVELLDHRGRGESLLQEAQLFATAGECTGHEGAVQGLHPTSEHLQGQGSARRG